MACVQRLLLDRIQLQILQQPVKKLHLADDQSEVVQPGAAQRLDGQRQHLGVGLGLPAPISSTPAWRNSRCRPAWVSMWRKTLPA